MFTPDGRARESCPFGASAFYRSRGEEVGVRAFTKMEASRGLKPEIFFKDDDSYEYAFSRDVEPFEVEAKENWGYKAGSLGGEKALRGRMTTTRSETMRFPLPLYLMHLFYGN